jgi:hypothetical protein
LNNLNDAEILQAIDSSNVIVVPVQNAQNQGLGEFENADDRRDEALYRFDNEDRRTTRPPTGTERARASRQAQLQASRAGSPSHSQLSQMFNEREGRQLGPSGLSTVETRSQSLARQRLRVGDPFGDIPSSPLGPSVPRSYNETLKVPDFKNKLMTLRDDNN